MGAFFEALVNHSDRIISALLNLAVAATLLILAVCVYRALSPKAPKWTRLFLWALAGLRLCLPFSIRSAWSLVPSEKILDYETAQYAAKPEITSGIAALNRAVNPAFGESFAATPAASVNPLQIWMHLAGIVWAVGVLALLFAARGLFLGFCAASVAAQSGASALLRYRLDTLLSDVGTLLLCLWLAGWAVRLAMELFRAVRGRAARETPGTARRLAVRFAAALALSAAFAAVGAVLAVIGIGSVGR